MTEATQAPRVRVPIRADYFRVPEEAGKPPEILGSRCRSCDECFFPRRVVCAKCLARDTEPTVLSPHGTLYSFTFVHFPMFGSTNAEHMGGYGVGQVDLPEGPRIQVPLAGALEDYRVGQPVVAEIEPLRDDDLGREIVILRFRPLGGSAR